MRSSKRLTILVSLCLILTVFLSIYLIGCNSLLTSTPKKQQPQTPTSFVSVDINPSIELILDQNGVVMSVAGANHDGKVLLFDEDGIVGSSLDVAIGNITSLAVKYGYLTENNDTISVNVVSDENTESILKTLENSIQKVATSAELSLSLKQEVSLSLQQELSSLKDKYPGDDNIQSLDVAHLCLAKRAQQNGESLLDVCTKSVDELLLRVNEAQSDAMSKFDTYYSTQVEEAQYLFDSACSILQNGLRVSFYLDNAGLFDVEALTNAYTSLKYTLAKSTKLMLEYFDTCLDLNCVDAQYHLEEESLQSIANMLGTTYDELLSKTHAKENDGHITVEEQDLTSYINTLYRNADETSAQAIKSAYSSIGDILSSSLTPANGRDGAVDFMKNTIESALASTPLSSLNTLANTYAEHITTLIEGFFPSDLDLADKQSIADAIEQLDAEISSLEEALPSEDEQAFLEYCEQNALAQKIAQLRNELSNTLDTLKQNAINTLSKEKTAIL